MAEFRIISTVKVDSSQEWRLAAGTTVMGTANHYVDSSVFIAILNEVGQPIVPTTYQIIENTHDVLNYKYLDTVGMPPWMKGAWSPVSNMQRYFSSIQDSINVYLDDIDRYYNSKFVNTATGFANCFGIINEKFASNVLITDSTFVEIEKTDNSIDLFLEDPFLENKCLIKSQYTIIRYAGPIETVAYVNGQPYEVIPLNITDDLDSWGYLLDLYRHNKESDGEYSTRLNYEFGTTTLADEEVLRYANSTDFGLRAQLARFTGEDINDITVQSVIDYTNLFMDNYDYPDIATMQYLKNKYDWGSFIYNRITWWDNVDLNRSLYLIHTKADSDLL